MLFLIISYLRKSEYDKKHLKKFFYATDWSLVCIATGYFAPIVVFINYISHCRKDKIFEWIYDILYKIANIGVEKKSDNEKKGSDKDEIV